MRQIAKRFLVSLSFVIRLLRHYRTTGSLDPNPHGGRTAAALGPASSSDSGRWSASSPMPRLRSCASSSASIAATWPSRALEKLKITWKKKVLHAHERDSPEVQQKRRDFRKEWRGSTRNGWSSSTRLEPIRR